MNRNKIISIIAVCFIIIGIAVAVVGGVGGSSKNELTDDNMDDTVIVDVDAGKDDADTDIVTDEGERDTVEIDKSDEKEPVEYVDDIYYEKDPEYIQKLEATYGKDNLLYVDGKSYCLVDYNGEGIYFFSKSVCTEGDDRLTNTLIRSDYQFIKDNFLSIEKVSMSTSEYDNSEIAIIIANKDTEWSSLTLRFYFYDKDGVVLEQDETTITNVRKNTKYRLTANHYSYGDEPVAESFRITEFEANSVDGNYYIYLFE